MELRQLKYFVKIAQMGNFSKASKQLYVSQSALSQQIRLLEDELNVRLFVRNKHSVSLTECGSELLPLAVNILQNVIACRERINSLKDLVRGELNIGVTFTLEPCVREAMLGFMKVHPNITVNAYYRSVSELLHELHNNKVDVMFSFMPTEEHDFVEAIPIASHRLMAAMSTSHPLASKEVVSQHDLCHQRIILPDTGLNEHTTIGYYMQAKVSDVHICSHINNANAILNLLQCSNYISILTASVIMTNPRICARPIENVVRPIQTYALLNRDTPRKHCVNAFLEQFNETSAYYFVKHL